MSMFRTLSEIEKKIKKERERGLIFCEYAGMAQVIDCEIILTILNFLIKKLMFIHKKNPSRVK